MKSDCEDPFLAKMASSSNTSSSTTMVSSSNLDIIQMLTAISSQMASNYQALQDQMVQNDLHLSTQFQGVVQDNDTFKQDVHVELNTL
jgi:hypothetical protein